MSEMRIIVAGGRSYKDYNRVKKVMDFLLQNTDKSTVTIISGGALGADALGEDYAEDHDLMLERYPADWDNLDAPGAVIKYPRGGKPYNAKAGYDRNLLMAQNATHLVAFPGGKGTADMIRTAKKLGLIIREIK